MEELKKELGVIRESQIRMEQDIKHHIRRTDLLEELHKDNERRIVILEEPAKAKQYLFEFVLNVSKTIGLITGVLLILRYFGKI